MKKFSLSVATVLAMGAFAVAGGDIEPVIEPVVEVTVADAWVGPYVGLQAGYIWGDADTSSYWEDGSEAFSLNDFNVDGWAGGIFAGYNWRVSNNILLGIEGEWNYVSADDTIMEGSSQEGYGSKVEQTWDASLRLRAGMDMGDYMPYITGGIAWAGVESHGYTTWGYTDDQDETLTGWTLGAGVEKKINENLIARIQYRYSDYGDATWTIDPGNDVDTGKIEYSAHMLTVGVSYRF